MRPGHLFIVGFMGAGKSTVARMVAEQIGLPCIDLDAEIERHEGMPVTRIFESVGEDGFRARESEALRALESAPRSVVACGGGIVIRPDNRVVLKRLGTVVYLQVTAAEALARVGDVSTRPLLSGPSGMLAATSLLTAREGLYRSVADIEVDTVGRGPDEVASLVVERVRGAK